MSKPVVIITAIFTFLGVWSDFMGPLIYLQTRRKARSRCVELVQQRIRRCG